MLLIYFSNFKNKIKIRNVCFNYKLSDTYSGILIYIYIFLLDVFIT